MEHDAAHERAVESHDRSARIRVRQKGLVSEDLVSSAHNDLADLALADVRPLVVSAVVLLLYVFFYTSKSFISHTPLRS